MFRFGAPLRDNQSAYLIRIYPVLRSRFSSLGQGFLRYIEVQFDLHVGDLAYSMTHRILPR